MKNEALSHKLWAKVLAYFLLTLCAGMLALSALGIAGCWGLEVYTNDRAGLVRGQFLEHCIREGAELVTQGLRGASWRLPEQRGGNVRYRIEDAAGRELWSSGGDADAPADDYRFALVYRRAGDERAEVDAAEAEDRVLMRTDFAVYMGSLEQHGKLRADEYLVEAVVDPALPVQDGFYWFSLLIGLLYSLRFAIYGVAALSLVLGVLCFIFLMCGAGHRAGQEGLVPGYLHAVPFDLLSLLMLLPLMIPIGIGIDLGDAAGAVLVLLTLVAAAPLGAGWCAALAARVKLGGWWRNTLVVRCLSLCLRLLRGVLRVILGLFRGLGRAVGALFSGLPLIRKTALGLFLLCLFESIGIAVTQGETGALLLLWLLEKLLLVPAVLWLALTLRRLQAGGRALAAGELGHQTDTSRMRWDFREHGENLNAIAQGMSRAVESQLKSERLKTELITNVSHDLKTPLTSILNYVGLLQGAETQAQRAEYLDVLDRQAHKLKKLTEDLVEVSKASTGNLEVNASRRSVSELLRQAAGEYAERMEAAALTPVLTLPEKELFATVDGTLLWRVLDNLFSNACKYAQPGTRFYIEAVPDGERVALRFKNISREQLNVSAGELTERFVRGDRARGGEGSGLGLNIAKSLTELQGGSFSLSVDGDLFKAELRLPA